RVRAPRPRDHRRRSVRRRLADRPDAAVTTRSVVEIVIAFEALFWIASAYWTYKGAHRRIDDPWRVGFATALGLVPYAGPLVYMLFRPPEYLEDVRERELEIKAMEDRLSRR